MNGSRGAFGGLHRGLRVEKNDEGAGHGSDHGEEGQHAHDIARGSAAEESERHCGDGRQRETLPDEMEQGPTSVRRVSGANKDVRRSFLFPFVFIEQTAKFFQFFLGAMASGECVEHQFAGGAPGKRAA